MNDKIKLAGDGFMERVRKHSGLYTALAGYSAEMYYTDGYTDALNRTDTGWTRCDERLPEFADEKWLTIEDASTFVNRVVCRGQYFMGGWRWLRGKYEDLPQSFKVVAWRDVEATPAPYSPDNGADTTSPDAREV